MLIHPTVERLRALGLSAMADAFIEMQNTPEAAELTREDWLGLLIDRVSNRFQLRPPFRVQSRPLWGWFRLVPVANRRDPRGAE